MPAIVRTKFLGNPEVEQRLRTRMEQFFERYLDTWTVSILGAQGNDVWKLEVIAPDDRAQVHEFYGHDGGHDLEKIMAIVERTVIALRSERSASAGMD